MVPRSIWNGTISFGLVSVPIKVHSATEDRTVHFHQVHAEDGGRINQKRICSKEGKEVPYKQVVKGFEVREGEYVVLSQEEIDAAAGERSHQIELEEFVCAPQIDPVYFARTYYLGAGDGGEGAYRLLHDALARAKRAGLGRWVFHNREYLVAVRSLDGAIALHTMRFADELVATNKIEVPAPSRAPTKQEVKMASALVDSLHDRFDASAFKDTYRERVLDLIERKAKGEEIETPEYEEPDKTPDLLAALEASLADRGGPKRSSGSKRSGTGSRSRPSRSSKSSKSSGSSKRTKARS